MIKGKELQLGDLIQYSSGALLLVVGPITAHRATLKTILTTTYSVYGLGYLDTVRIDFALENRLGG
jgi:hypothetical protein